MATEQLTPAEQINPAVTYDAIKEDITNQSKNLKALYQSYLDSGEISAEELDEVYPELQDDIKFYEGVATKLGDTKTREWFIDNMQTKINEKVTEEQMSVILEGLGYLTEVETILIGGTRDLLEFVAPEGGGENKLN